MRGGRGGRGGMGGGSGGRGRGVGRVEVSAQIKRGRDGGVEKGWFKREGMRERRDREGVVGRRDGGGEVGRGRQ